MGKIRRESHIFDRDEHDHYVEPFWCSRRFFEEEDFEGGILDPCCGWGRIVGMAKTRGHHAIGSDIVDRKPKASEFEFRQIDVLGRHDPWLQSVPNIVSNPPFDRIEEIARRCLMFAAGKVALICPLRRLPAAWPWLETTPLLRVWMLTPRPSMPTGEHIESGGKVGGGTQDYVWLVWEKSYDWLPSIEWLHREKQ